MPQQSTCPPLIHNGSDFMELALISLLAFTSALVTSAFGFGVSLLGLLSGFFLISAVDTFRLE